MPKFLKRLKTDSRKSFILADLRDFKYIYNYTNLIKIYKYKLSIINLKALKSVYTVLIYNLIS